MRAPNLETWFGTRSDSREERRRSQRLELQLPLVLSSTSNRHKLSEQCMTLVVNSHGCQVRSSRPFEPGTQVLLELTQSGQVAAARVIHCEPTWLSQEAQAWTSGLSLDLPGNFWGVAEPPQDWSAAPLSMEAGEPPSPALIPSESAPTSHHDFSMPRHIAGGSLPTPEGQSQGFAGQGAQHRTPLLEEEQGNRRVLAPLPDLKSCLDRVSAEIGMIYALLQQRGHEARDQFEILVATRTDEAVQRFDECVKRLTVAQTEAEHAIRSCLEAKQADARDRFEQQVREVTNRFIVHIQGTLNGFLESFARLLQDKLNPSSLAAPEDGRTEDARPADASPATAIGEGNN